MVRLVASLLAVGSVLAAAASPCQGDNETCSAAASALDEAEDQVSAIQIRENGQSWGKWAHKCPRHVFGCKTVQSIVDAVESVGTLAHAFAIAPTGFEAITTAGKIADFNLLNDCAHTADACGLDNGHIGNGIPFCSGWSFIKTGFVPMVFNWPANFYFMHGVGLLVKSSQSMQSLITRRTVFDGDTCDRTAAGMWIGADGKSVVVDFWQKQCPGWKNVEDTGVACVRASVTGSAYACNEKLGRFEVQVGSHGQDWPKRFLYNEQGQARLDWETTMEPQCSFEDQSLFEGALKAAYSELASLSVKPAAVNGLGYPYPTADYILNGPETYYLETELNMETEGVQLVEMMKDDMLAITVQQTPCVESLHVLRKLGVQEPEKFCAEMERRTEEDVKKNSPGMPVKEADVIGESLRVACLVQSQLQEMYQKEVPVVDAKFLSNAMTQASWIEYATDRTCECDKFCEIDCKKVSQG